MKIKSYRAASLREALLQIKQELGEDALVVETKHVRAGGFLGVGARNLVEVRVAPSPKPGSNKDAGRTRKSSASAAPTGLKVNLRDDSAAVPALADKAAHSKEEDGVLAALAARAGAGRSLWTANAKPEQAVGAAPRPGDELAEAVRRRSASAPAANGRKQVVEEGRRLEIKSEPSSRRNNLSVELGRLRAEVREVKFALGAFAAQPAARGEMSSLAPPDADPALYDSPCYETYLELTSAGLSPELAQQAARSVAPPGAPGTPGTPGTKDRRDVSVLAREALAAALPGWVRFAETAVTVQAVAAFIGPTGVGKTTTIAKLAAHIALRARRRVELITLDTYRIAAVQQLKTYADIIGAKCHVARSVVELDALTRRFAGEATVLVDTTGRSPHDLADQMELADYMRENKAVLKCLVLPATTHAADAQLALHKFALYGANRLVLTKLDETVQLGSFVEVAAEAKLPLMYLCAGQRVPEDLERATAQTFAARVVRARMLARAA